MPINITTDPATGAVKATAEVPKEIAQPAAKPETRAGRFSAATVVTKATRDIAQELLGNLPADELSKLRVLGGVPRLPGAPDAPILGIFPPLPKVEASNWESNVAGFVQGAMAWALASRGLRSAGRAAARLPGAPAAAQFAAPVTQPLRAAAARATAAPGLRGLAGRAGVATIREAPASAVAGYAGFKPEEQRVSDHILRWVEEQAGTPLYGPLKALTAPALLGQSTAGDTASQARWKNSVESLLIFDPASNAVVESLGLLARAGIRRWQTIQAGRPAAEQIVDASAREAAPPVAPTAAAAAGPSPQPKPKPKPKAPKQPEPELPDPWGEQTAKAEVEYQQALDRAETAIARAANTVPDEMGGVLPEARAVERPSYSQVQETPVAQIATDPQRFQFKEAGRLSKTGVSGSLKEAAEYDPLFGKIISVWRDPADGQLYVVNGHNRLDLARRSGRENILTWEIEAPTAEQARAIGAMENMAEGMGTPWDAAKIMRDMGMDLEQLRQRNINVRGPIAEKAIPLSRLPQEIFNKGATGKLDLAKAVALGSEQLDEAVVRDVAAAAAKGKWSAEKILQAMQEAKFAQTELTGGMTLPGMEEWATKGSDFSIRADVRAEAYRSLREEMIALTSAARITRKDILEAAGNVIDVAGSQAARDQAAQAAAVFNKVTGYTGPVRDVLNQMVEAVKAGRTVKKAVEEALDTLRQAIDAEINGPRLPLEEPAPAAPEAPVAQAPVQGELPDTRGQGEFFHGTAKEIDRLEEGYYESSNIYGQGFYVTDDLKTAGSYTKKNARAVIKEGETPSQVVYRVTEVQPVKFYDLDAPVSPTARGALESATKYSEATVRALDELDADPNMGLSKVMDEIRSNSRAAGESRDTIQEVFDGVREALQGEGYGGFTHTGGRLTKTGREHQVRIYWDAANQLSLEKVDPQTLAPAAEVPAAAEAPAAPAVSPAQRAETKALLDRVLANLPPERRAEVQRIMEERAAQAGPRMRAEVPEPEGPVPVDPPAGPENSDDWTRRFAREVQGNKQALENGEVTMEDLMANNFQKVQSPSGRTVYTAQREDLVEGLNAMSKVLPDRPTESGIPVMDVDSIRRMNQDWFTRHGEDSEAIMAGLQSITRGFDDYQQGALNRAMALADKKQVEAAQEAAMWLNSANFEGVNESERLARLVTAAESSRAVHQAVMRVTRRWGQLGLEMQIPRDYEIPADQNVKDASIPQTPVEPETGVGPGRIDVEGEIRAELEAEQVKPIEETLTNKLDPELTEAINGGEITPRAAAAADALAQSLVSIAADSKARTKFWRNFDDTRTFTPNALLMLRTSNLISSGVTTATNVFNGMLNLSRLPLQQAAGAALKGELKRSMYSLMMFQQYWLNMSNALRVAGHAFKAGQSLFNLENSSVDYLSRLAKQDLQGELMEGPDAMTGWTVNTINMGQEMAQKPLGQMANHLWRLLGTGGTRMALTIETFNPPRAGYAYEHARHLPGGMELAVERGMEDMSPEAFKWAQQYADARTQETIKDVVINGKNLADVHMDSPRAQSFMDAVNFTDKIWAELEPRTYGEGVRLGQARGLEGEELQKFAQQYVEEGTTLNKVAEFFTTTPIGRLGSMPGEAMDTLSNARYIGPVFKFLQPFVRVPNNIIKSAMRNTPAAAFVDTFWRDITSEDPFTRDRALGEIATGSAVLGLITMASAMGYVRFNGGGPLDPAARQRWIEIEGRMPYSYQTWDEEAGKWARPASMRAMEPFATLFGAIGDYADIANSLSTEARNRLGGSLVLTLARMSTSGVLSKGYFQGFTEMYEAFFNPSKVLTGPNQRDAMARYLSRLVASTLVPYSSALRAARREVDPVSRTVNPSDVGGLMGFFQETLDEVRNAVPGWSSTLPARRDYINGQPILTTGIIGAEQLPAEMPFLQALMQFTPMAAIQVGRQPRGLVHEEMARLHGKGTSFLGPRAADFGTEMRLTPSELEDYILTFATVKDEFGRTFEQSATELIQSEQYQSWPIEGSSSRFVGLRAAAIQEEIQRYKELAKEQYKASTPKGQLILLEEAELEADKGEKNYLRRYGGGTSAQPSGAKSWSITPR